MKKFFLICVACVFFLFGCGNNEVDDSQNKTNGASFTIGAIGEDTVLVPTLANDLTSINIIDQIYETLFKFNYKTRKYEPLLASSIAKIDDNSWEVHLREGVSFHDGTPFNAEAVLYTFNKVKESKQSSLLQAISVVESTNDMTIIIRTFYPYENIMGAFSHPATAIISPTADQTTDLAVNPSGTGAYIFETKNDNNDIFLKKNKNYWQKPASINKVLVKMVSKPDTVVSMLERGAIKFIGQINAKQINELKSIKSVEIQSKKGINFYYLAFNTNKAPGDNLNFRIAIANAIDYKKLVKKTKGLGYESQGLIGPELFGYNPTIEDASLKFDLDTAKKSVIDNNLSSASFKMIVLDSPAYTDLADVIVKQLETAGFKGELVTQTDKEYKKLLDNGDYTIALGTYNNLTYDGGELVYQFLGSDNAGGTNFTKYSNQALDQLILETRSSVDTSFRRKKLHEINEFIAHEAPVIPLYHSYSAAANYASVDGIELTPSGQWYLYGAKVK